MTNALTSKMEPHVLERPKRFSKSRLWQLQSEWFEKRGAAAWRETIVPSYVTSNPFIARCFARQILGAFRDLENQGLQPDQPIYILELGAGSGRFAYHFLSFFTELLARSTLYATRFCYVLSDQSPKTLDFWRQHPRLEPYFENGTLDLSLFDSVNDTSLKLEQGKKTLHAGNLRNPLIVIANYLFDSLPHDAFRAQRGELSECLVGLTSTEASALASTAEVAPSLEDLAPKHAYRSIPDSYYGETHRDGILRDYRQALSDSHFLIPVGALGCLDHLRTLAEERLILISADMGPGHPSEVEGQPAPVWNTHGSISLPVNFDAIGRYAKSMAGEVLLTAPDPAHLTLGVFILGLPTENLVETKLAFNEAFAEPGPDAFFVIKKQLERFFYGLSFEGIKACLRLSQWDAEILQLFYPRILELAGENLSPRQEEALSWMIGKIWSGHFAIDDDSDLPFHLGSLLHSIGYFNESLEYLEHSLHVSGPTSPTLHLMGLCHYSLRKFEAARTHFIRSLEIDKDQQDSRDMLQRLALRHQP